MARTSARLISFWRTRGPERSACAWSVLALAIGQLAVVLSRSPAPDSLHLVDFLPLGVYLITLTLLHLTLVVARFEGDLRLLGSYAFLSGIGILIQSRMHILDFTDSNDLGNFAYPLSAVLLLMTVLIFKQGRYRWLSSLAWPSGLLSLATLVWVLLSGSRFRGAVYAPGNVTPTEILKLLVVVFLAARLSRHLKPPRGAPAGRVAGGQWIATGGLYAVLIGLLLWQRDLGMAAVLIVTGVVCTFAATGSKPLLVGITALALAGGGAAVQFFYHSQVRFQIWRNPFGDPTGSGWQLLQGLTGMFSGGLWGAGFGKGSPESIPIAESDFIYAVIGEELGYVGCLFVILAFLLLFKQTFEIAQRSETEFGGLLVCGLGTVLASQTFLNVAGVTKFAPLTGIPLPFISRGGSNLATMSVCLGLILAVSDAPGRASPRPSPSRRRRVSPKRRPKGTPPAPRARKSRQVSSTTPKPRRRTGRKPR